MMPITRLPSANDKRRLASNFKVQVGILVRLSCVMSTSWGCVKQFRSKRGQLTSIQLYGATIRLLLSPTLREKKDIEGRRSQFHETGLGARLRVVSLNGLNLNMLSINWGFRETLNDEGFTYG